MQTAKEEYKRVGAFFLMLAALIVAGFYKSYFGLFPHFDNNIVPFTHVHAFVMSLYVVLLIVQPLLIRNKQYRMHRLLGKFSYVLVLLIVSSFFLMTYKQYGDLLAQRVVAGDFKEDVFLNISKLVLFTGLYLLAIINKRNTASHMRYIIATALVFVEPSFSRVTFFWLSMDFLPSMLSSFALADSILIALIFFDNSKRYNYRPYVIALGSFIIYQTLWYIVFHAH